MIVEWSTNLELGIPELDEQHKKLVNMLNNFYKKLKDGGKKDAVEYFLDELENYLNYHLDYEEEFMKKIGFPELKNHEKIHDTFKKMYAEHKDRYLKGDKKALRELVAFTFSWLCFHIRKTDKKYAEFAKSLKK